MIEFSFFDVVRFYRYEDVLCAVLNMCADYFETERYITPSERYALLRTMPYLIFLLDGDDEKHTLSRVKHFHPERFQKIFKVNNTHKCTHSLSLILFD
jgi:hypothetical protein